MIRRFLGQLLILAAPSVPLGLRGQVAAHASAVDVRGEARAEAESGKPEGGTNPPSRPPATHPELLRNWRPEPQNRGWLNDMALAGALDAWSEGSR